jgi:DNA-directed RNA polymerase specialized sigma24 family protein/DNA-binding XRE family transcriptional regulator
LRTSVIGVAHLGATPAASMAENGHDAKGADIDPPTFDAVLPHRITVQDVRRTARICAPSTRRVLRDAHDYAERYQAACVSVIEYLYLTDRAPTHEDLLRAARRGVKLYERGNLRHWGVVVEDGEPRRRTSYYGYWLDRTRSDESPETRIVEPMATRQILSALNATYRQALLAFAACDGSYRDAAAVLDISQTATQSRVNRARALFLALWHEYETPRAGLWRRQAKRSDETLVPCGTPAAAHRHRRRQEQVCQPCLQAEAQARAERWAKAQANTGTAALGAQLRELRTARGMTYADVARAVGVRYYTIATLEKGLVQQPTPGTVKRIDEVLDAGGVLVAMLATTEAAP